MPLIFISAFPRQEPKEATMAQKLNKLRDKWLLIGVALIAALGIAACGGESSSDPLATSVEGEEPVLLNSVLSGNQVSAASGGPVATNAGGSGVVILSADRTAIDFTFDAGPLADFNSPVITGAHIHVRDSGADNGPSIFVIDPVAPLPDPLVISGTLTADDLIPQPNVPDFPAAVEALLNGMAYFQVYTEAHPPGEVRGYIGNGSLAADLNGAQAVPTPVITNATGTGTVVVSANQSSLSVSLSVTGLSSTIQGAHIHFGAAGTNGPIIFNFALPSTAPPSLVINVVLTAANLLPQPAVASFPAAVDALLSGNTYFQVHTANHPGGEVRGQILPVR
jgi:hypothetical protein